MTAILGAPAGPRPPVTATGKHEFLLLSQQLADPDGRHTLLGAVVAARQGGWIGGRVGQHVRPRTDDRYATYPVPLDRAEAADHLGGLCARSIAPIFHDSIVPAAFEPGWYSAYRAVNRRFAAAAAQRAAVGGVVMVYGHHLQLVPALLRAHRPDLLIGYFLELPFPPGELFRRLPVRDDLLDGVLGADAIGLQSTQSADNLRRLALDHPRARLGQGGLSVAGRPVAVDAFPESVDVGSLRRQAARPRTRDRAEAIRAGLGHPHRILLAVDGLEPSAGIEERLAAYEAILDAGEADPERTVLVQVVRPCPGSGPSVRALRERIERTVGRINGRYGRVGRPALHYLHSNPALAELVALYTAADVLLATPLRAGMSRSAKEYVASRADNSGAVVLSEFSATAAELEGPVVVNPYDAEDLRRGMVTVLRAAPSDLRQRMSAMRRHVQTHDVHRWAGAFLATVGQWAARRDHRYPRWT
jgi:trehalose 6-phosphate synthase